MKVAIVVCTWQESEIAMVGASGMTSSVGTKIVEDPLFMLYFTCEGCHNTAVSPGPRNAKHFTGWRSSAVPSNP